VLLREWYGARRARRAVLAEERVETSFGRFAATTAVPNGAHTISVVITDATSRTGTASVGVTVAN